MRSYPPLLPRTPLTLAVFLFGAGAWLCVSLLVHGGMPVMEGTNRHVGRHVFVVLFLLYSEKILQSFPTKTFLFSANSGNLTQIPSSCPSHRSISSEGHSHSCSLQLGQPES